MKKKAMAGNEQTSKDNDKPKQAPANLKTFKAAIDKKEAVDYRSQLIAEKRAKKAQKHQNKKIEKLESQLQSEKDQQKSEKDTS